MKYQLEYGLGFLLTRFYNSQYWMRYKKFQAVRLDKQTLYIHIPKTGGSAVCNALGISKVGHFTVAQLIKASGSCEKIIVTVRDPFDRFMSLWKYSRKESQARVYSPLYVLRKYKTIEDFLASGYFAAFVKYHYFFRTQRSYLEGYDENLHELVIIRQEHLADDVQRELQLEIKAINVSPSMKIEITKKSKEHLKSLYSKDYALLALSQNK